VCPTQFCGLVGVGVGRLLEAFSYAEMSGMFAVGNICRWTCLHVEQIRQSGVVTRHGFFVWDECSVLVS
jgi:hypothetical protein